MSILRVRRSQLISKHGVGSIFPGTDGISRLTAGLDEWFTRDNDDKNEGINKDAFKIKEWRLEKRLGVSHFKAPPDYRKFEEKGHQHLQEHQRQQHYKVNLTVQQGLDKSEL